MFTKQNFRKVAIITIFIMLFLAIPSAFADDSSDTGHYSLSDNSFNSLNSLNSLSDGIDDVSIDESDSNNDEDNYYSLANQNEVKNEIGNEDYDTNYKINSNLESSMLKEGSVWSIQESGENYGSLADAITAAESGNTIVCIEPTSETLSNITVSKNLTIKATNRGDASFNTSGVNAFTLTRNNTLNLVNLVFSDYSLRSNIRGGVVDSAGNLYVENCTFSNIVGIAQSNYGVVFHSDGKVNLTIINSLFNSINAGFAPIYASSNNVYIANSTFKDVKSQNNAGAVYMWGSNTTIENCNFTDSNTGQALIYATQSNLNVSNSIFRNITSSDETSAISTTYRSNATVTGCIFDLCKSTYNGGNSAAAILSQGNCMNITNSIFTNCINTANFASNYTFRVFSGAVLIDDGNVNYCIFLNNSVNENSKYKFKDIVSTYLVNADYNYWGSNAGPDDTEINADNVTVNNWYILTMDSAEPIVGESTELLFKLNQINTSSGDISQADVILPDINLVASTEIGNLQSNDLNIVNGQGSLIYSCPDYGRETISFENVRDSFDFNVSANPLTVIYVAGNGSDSNTGAEDSPYQTIEYALSQVTTTRNVIYINSGNYNERNLRVSKSVTIVSLGDVSIDAQGNGHIFIVDEGVKLGIKDMTLLNANSTENGGALLVNGDLTAINLTVKNSIGLNGGAIYLASSSSSFISNCNFENNNAINDGGAIYAAESASGSISGSSFKSNHAVNDGGAIAIAGALNVSSCEFELDKAISSGGAIAIKSNGNSKIIISGNTYIEENAVNGGAIYIEGSNENISIIDGIFIENTADYGGAIYIKDSTVKLSNNNMGGNEANVDGDRIYINNGKVNGILTYLDKQIVNAHVGDTISLNATATDDMGNEISGGEITFIVKETEIGVSNILNGVARMDYTVTEYSSSDLTVWGNYSGFTNNYTLYRGFIHLAQSYWFIEGGSSYELLSDAIANARAGDVIYGLPGNYTITRITIDKDITIKALEKDTVFLKGFSTQIFNITRHAKVNLINLTMSKGASSGFGGLIVLNGSLNISNCTLKDSILTGAESRGGAIFAWDDSHLVIESSTFKNISCTNLGGAIYVYYPTSTLDIINSSFDNISGDNTGSVIYATAPVNIVGSNFTNIDGPFYEGSITNYYGAIFAGYDLNILDSRFINITGPSASVIYAPGEDSKVNISRSVFAHNFGVNTTIWSLARENYINYCIFDDNVGYSGNYWDIIATGTNTIVFDANYNYWESNEKPIYNFNDKVSVDYWTVLDLSIDKNMFVAGTNNDIFVDFTHYTDGVNNYSLSEKMPDYEFSLNATAGTIDSPINVVDGTAIANYLAPNDNVHVIVSIKPGDETLEFDVMKTESLIYVSNAGSDILGEGTLNNPYATIGYALTKVDDTRNIIYLENGIYKEHGLDITKSVTIQGKSIENTIVDGENISTIFNIQSDISVIIKSLSLTNGKGVNGGAIYAGAGNLVVNNTRISSSSANKGSAIYLDADAIIDTCIFEDNNDESQGVIYLNDGDLTLLNNRIENNSTNDIYINGGTVNAVVKFLNNKTVEVPKYTSYNLTANLTDDSGNTINGGYVGFRFNGAYIGEAAVDNGIASLEFLLPNNEAIYPVSGNYSNGNAKVTIKNGAIRSIKLGWFIGDVGYETLKQAVDAAQSGDIIIGVAGTYNVSNIEIGKDLTIKANQSGTVVLHVTKQDLFYVDPSYTLNMEGLICENIRDYRSNFVYNDGGEVNIENCTFRDSYLNSLEAVLYSYYGVMNINNSNFHNLTVNGETSSNYGSAIFADSYSRLTVTNSRFEDTYSLHFGGAIGVYSASEATIINCTFINTSAGFRGGAIYNGMSSSLTVINSTFINSSASNYGGAICEESGRINVTRSVFIGNTASRRGGAIYVARNATINYNIFLDNKCNNLEGSRGTDVYYYWYNESYPDDFADLNLNYWGNNSGPGNKVSASAICENWVVLIPSISSDNVTLNSNYTVIADLTKYKSGDDILDLDQPMPKFDLDLSAVLGEIDSRMTVEDGEGRAIYTPVAIGEETISFLLTDQAIKFNVSAGPDYILKSNITEITIDLGKSIEVQINVYDYLNELSTGLDGKEALISYRIGDEAYTLRNKFITGSKLVFDLNELDKLDGGCSATIEVGVVDEAINLIKVNIMVNVNKLNSTVSAEDLEAIKGIGILDIALSSGDRLIDSRNVTVKIDDYNFSALTNSRGIAHIRLDELDIGDYTAFISFAGDETYESSNCTVNIKIVNPVVSISANDVECVEGSGSLKISLTVNGMALQDKSLTIIIKDRILNATTNFDGIATVDLSFLNVGEHTAYIAFAGDEIYPRADSSCSITVYPTGTVLVNHTGNDALDIQTAIDNANPGDTIQLGKYDYSNVSDINVTKDLTIAGCDGTTISSSSDGNAIFNIPPLSDEGPSSVNITGIDFKVNNGDVIVKAIAENGTDSLSIDVAQINIMNNTVEAIEDGVVAESVTVLKLESERGVLAPSNEIVISGNTMDAGIVPFEFDVTSVNDGSNVDIPSGPMVAERIETQIVYENMTTTAVDVDTDGRVGEYFYITLKDKNGNLLKNKPIQIGFNGVVYDRTTDGNGSARLQINLKNAGTYTFAVSYLGDDEYNGSFIVAKIVVNKQKGSLTVPAKSYKASAASKTLTATFKSASGKVVKGKKITFTVNGKSYSATTNAKGVATVKVSLNTKGTYSFTAKFAGNTMYAAISKTAKLTIK